MKQIIKIVTIASKVIAVLGAITALVWGAFTFHQEIFTRFDHLEGGINDNSEIGAEALDIAKENQKTNLEIQAHQSEQDEHMTDMESAARFYIHNQAKITRESMEEVMEIMLKKNEQSIVWPPPLPNSIQREREGQRDWNAFLDYVLITGPVTLKESPNPL